MIQLVAECWAALAVDWGCLWGTERVWVLPSRWMNGPSGQSSVSGSHRPEILLAGSQQTSKQWCLCADPGPLGGQNSFDSTGQRGGGTKAAHDQCPPDFGSVCHLQFVFLVHNRKDNTFIKVEFFIFFFAFFNYISFFKTPLAFFYVTFYPHRVSWLFMLLMLTVFLWLWNGGSSWFWLFVTDKLSASFGLTSLLWCFLSALYFGQKLPIPLTLHSFKRKQMLSL